MCYLCEKYAQLAGIEEYDPSIDPSVTGTCIVPLQDTEDDLYLTENIIADGRTGRQITDSRCGVGRKGESSIDIP
jgi:hypothetical protein